MNERNRFRNLFEYLLNNQPFNNFNGLFSNDFDLDKRNKEEI